MYLLLNVFDNVCNISIRLKYIICCFISCAVSCYVLTQVFRTDLITAMKVHDSYQLNPEDFYVLADPWRQEWEKGVQVPVSPQSIPQPVAR